MKKTLRDILLSPNLEFIMEAHNGISAKIVEEAGFCGIWASGLSISASYGVRDCNEASWTQIVDAVEFMADCTDLPILMDGDTGFGNYNNVRRLVKKLEKIGVEGCCIEDKIFPKSNSLIEGFNSSLANISEFCGKIKAAKDTQLRHNFCVIARTEAFIVGSNLEEALRRAYAYAEAGADGILIHSKAKSADQIKEFMRHWKSNAPIIIVPTTYDTTPTEVFKELGVSLVIWANHNLRASIYSMRKISRMIHTKSSIAGIDEGIASLEDIFYLTNVEELKKSEEIYMRNE